MAWLIPAFCALTIAVLILWRRRKPPPQPLTTREFWVYLPSASMPPMERFMDAMLASNPANRPGTPCITKREGILFSDIRLHLSILRRDRNTHVFRPDLLFDSCQYEAQGIAALNKAQAVAKLSYISESTLADRRHLQFMPHLAGAVARLGSAVAVLDVEGEHLWEAADFEKHLVEQPNQEEAPDQVRVAWHHGENGPRATTLGLRKVGHLELRTDCIPPDETTAVEALVTELARRTWAGETMTSTDIEHFGQSFRVEISPERGEAKVTISRLTSS